MATNSQNSPINNVFLSLAITHTFKNQISIPVEQKYGTEVLNSDAPISSDSEDESDEPPEVSEEMETQFLKTLALLKKKDPRIYDPGYKFYDEEEKESGTYLIKQQGSHSISD